MLKWQSQRALPQHEDEGPTPRSPRWGGREMDGWYPTSAVVPAAGAAEPMAGRWAEPTTPAGGGGARALRQPPLKPPTLADALAHQARQLAAAASAACALIVVAALMVWGYDYCLDEMAAAGERVQYPEARSALPRVVGLRLTINAVPFGFTAPALALTVLLLLHNVQRRPSCRLVCTLALWCVAMPATILFGDSQPESTLVTRGLVAAATLLPGLAAGAEVGRIVGSRHVGVWVMVAIAGFMAAGLIFAFLVTRFFSGGEDDGPRLLFVAVVMPVMLELPMLAFRCLALTLPGRHLELPLASVWSYSALVALIERWMIAEMHTLAGTAAAIAIVTLTNTLVYHSIARRDMRFFRGTHLYDARTVRGVAATIRMIAETTDMFACIATPAVMLLLRSGPARVAPAPGGVVLSGLVQLAACAAPEVAGVLLAGRLGGDAKRYARGLRRRARCLRGLPRWYWGVALFNVVQMSTVFVSLMGAPPGPNAWACAWSKSEGAWAYHRVPCPSAKEWLGL